MSARARNLRANKNSATAGNNKSNSKDSSSLINEEYYRRINVQPAVVDTPMSPRTAKWVRELTPVLEPYNFNLNEISDLIHRCHYDANQIELAVGNVIEDFSGHESGQWTKVGKNRTNGSLKQNNTNSSNLSNNSNINKNKNFNNTNSIKSGKQTYSQNNQSQNHVEGTNTNYNKSNNKSVKHHVHGHGHGHSHSHNHVQGHSHGHGQRHGHGHSQSQTQGQSHFRQARTAGDQGLQQDSNNASKAATTTGSNPVVTHVGATKASISNNPVDSTTTWANLARKNNNKDAGSTLEKSQITNSNNKDHKNSTNDTITKEKLSQDHSASIRQHKEQEGTQEISSLISKPFEKTIKEQIIPLNFVNDNTQTSSPSTSNIYSPDSMTGSGITAIDLGIKVGGISPPHGIQIGGGIDCKSHGIGVFLPEGRTIDPNANDGLLFGSFGAVDISKIPENQVQINNSIVSDNNSNNTQNQSSGASINSTYTVGGGHTSNIGASNVGAMSVVTGISENTSGIGSTGVTGSHLLNGWNTGGSSPSKDSSTSGMIVDQGLLHQNASQRNSGSGVSSGGSGVSGSNVHTSIKSSGIGNGYIGHSISGGAINNYNNLPIAGQGMVGSGNVYSSNPTLLSGNSGINYNETVVGGNSGSNGGSSGSASNGNNSNMALAAAAAAAAAANPYNYAYLNYAGYTANFPYMVGNTAAFGFPHYNTKPNGHHHPTPVFNQYSQGPNPNQHGLNGVYGIGGGAGGSGNTAVNSNTSGNVMVSDGIGVNYHSSNNQSPITMGGNSAHNHHLSSQNPSSYQNIQSILPPGMSHQQMGMGGSQQPNGNGNSLQNQMNLPMGFNNNGGSNEFGVDQTIPQAVFLGQPGTSNNNKLDNIGAHPGDFIHHQSYGNHHSHIQNPTSNANSNSQGNPNTGNPNSHSKDNSQSAASNFQGSMQYIGKPGGSGSNNTVSGTPNGTSGNSASGNPSGAVNGAMVGSGMDLAHQGQGVGGNSSSSNSSMFLPGRAQNNAGQAGQVGSGQSKQASVNFPGFHSSRTGGNSGFLQHNNNMWNNN
ncbi:Uncharacterized protein cmbei_8004510 [Cryptosporidium meleagridis]